MSRCREPKACYLSPAVSPQFQRGLFLHFLFFLALASTFSSLHSLNLKMALLENVHLLINLRSLIIEFKSFINPINQFLSLVDFCRDGI